MLSRFLCFGMFPPREFLVGLIKLLFGRPVLAHFLSHVHPSLVLVLRLALVPNAAAFSTRTEVLIAAAGPAAPALLAAYELPTLPCEPQGSGGQSPRQIEQERGFPIPFSNRCEKNGEFSIVGPEGTLRNARRIGR